MNPGHTFGWLLRKPDPMPCKVAFYTNLEVDEEPKACLHSGSQERGPRIPER